MVLVVSGKAQISVAVSLSIMCLRHVVPNNDRADTAGTPARVERLVRLSLFFFM